MKSKDYYYALIAISALGIMSQTFELFSDTINRILIAGGICVLAVFYLLELKNAREEYRKKKSYKFWKYFNLVSQDSAPVKKQETEKE
jgi:SNF family Na+-dependent transporter